MEQLEPKLKALEDEKLSLQAEIGHLDEKHQKIVEEKEELNKMMKDELESLCADMAKAKAKRQVVEEQLMIKTLEQAELRRQLKEADDEKMRIEQELVEQLEPKLKALEDEKLSLQAEIGHLDEKHQNL